jgi:YD repeat-containing protein
LALGANKSQGLSDETWTYGFDQRNQLVWAKHADTDGGAVDLRVDFKYDAFGNRIETTQAAQERDDELPGELKAAVEAARTVRQRDQPAP